MTNSQSRLSGSHGSQKSPKKQYVPPAISFDRPEKKKLSKNDVLALKLRSTPSDANSQTYELTVPFFKSGTPEEWLLVKKSINKVLVGQNITTGPPQFAMIRRILDGDALAKFDEKAAEFGTETVANCQVCLNEVTRHVFPQRALQYQRRYMRRYLRKPVNVSTRAFNARLVEMNAYLPEFPPFGPQQQLADDDLSEILEFAVPNSWNRTMVLQGFNASEKTTTEIVEFCERLEFTESLPGGRANNNNGNNNGKNFHTDSKSGSKHRQGDGKSSSREASNNNKNKRKSDTQKYCPLHDTHGHDISECKVLLNQASKMREAWKARDPETQRKNRKAREELNAVVEEVKKALQEGRIPKKKRRKASDVSSSYDMYNVADDFKEMTMRSSTSASSDSSDSEDDCSDT